ncbi:WcbI family polysaccharide biosynthesis putative acetyltransferase, partial [Brevundimonas sp.]
MKIGVLGNCQAQGVAQCIRLLAPQVEVTARSVSLADGDRAEIINDIAAEMAACDLALIQTLEEVQPRLTLLLETALTQSGSRARRWPPIIFRGFHPD